MNLAEDQMRAIAFGFQMASLVVSATGEASLLLLCFAALRVCANTYRRFFLHSLFDGCNHKIL